MIIIWTDLTFTRLLEPLTHRQTSRISCYFHHTFSKRALVISKSGQCSSETPEFQAGESWKRVYWWTLVTDLFRSRQRKRFWRPEQRRQCPSFRDSAVCSMDPGVQVCEVHKCPRWLQHWNGETTKDDLMFQDLMFQGVSFEIAEILDAFKYEKVSWILHEHFLSLLSS